MVMVKSIFLKIGAQILDSSIFIFQSNMKEKIDIRPLFIYLL